MKVLLIICISACIIVFASCSAILSSMYGFNKLRPIDEKSILHYSKKYCIPTKEVFELDSSYVSFIKNVDTVLFKSESKNHAQALQALYYDSKGQLQSFQVNCYAGGFPNLKWNRNKNMQVFPPKQQAPLDSLLSFYQHLNFFRPIAQTQELSIENYDYYIVVYWSRYLGRQSKRFIRYVQKNSQLAAPKKAKIVYVNNDNYLMQLEGG